MGRKIELVDFYLSKGGQDDQNRRISKNRFAGFLAYLNKLESGEIVEKELDINENPSIHCVVNKSKGVENANSFRNR